MFPQTLIFKHVAKYAQTLICKHVVKYAETMRAPDGMEKDMHAK